MTLPERKMVDGMQRFHPVNHTGFGLLFSSYGFLIRRQSHRVAESLVRAVSRKGRDLIDIWFVITGAIGNE